ncbi:hypothetical protein T09_10056 [Trichinella sp. T9]|nr:hypothetical protein T09_10056 [Trichinella sp. T9]
MAVPAKVAQLATCPTRKAVAALPTVERKEIVGDVRGCMFAILCSVCNMNLRVPVACFACVRH